MKASLSRHSALVQRLYRGVAPGAELAGVLGVSQATFSRDINAIPNVVQLGAARATQYALTRLIGGLSQWTIYQAPASDIGEYKAVASSQCGLRIALRCNSIGVRRSHVQVVAHRISTS